ncbi:MAG: GldG family protein [Verrucomicrobiota bacterium]
MANLNNFSWVRRIKGANTFLLAIMGVTLIIGLNFLASTHYVRRDLTENARYTLAPETRAFLASMENPVAIIVTITENADEMIFNDLEGLLREYVYYASRGSRAMISVEYVDLFQQRSRAQELKSDYGLDSENAILVVSEERQTLVNWTHLYAQNEDGEIYGFNGEQVFTSAVIEVSQNRSPVVYFLAGHGEMNIDEIDPSRGLSKLKQFLLERNYDVRGLDVTTVETFPEDADLVIVAGPQAPFRPIEVERLRNFLDDQGRLIVFLEPYIPHGLDDLFYDWGILADDRIIVDESQDRQIFGGDTLIRQFAGEHPVTAFLIDNQLSVLAGQPRPVRINPGRPEDDSLTITQIMGSSGQSWAERSYRVEDPPVYSAGIDIPGPVPIATVSERAVGSDLGLSLEGGKLAVFGNSDMLANGRFSFYGNQIMANNLLNWSVGQSEMLSIPPRSVQEFQLALSQPELMKLLLWLMSVPLGVALVGAAILLLRRI